MAKFEKGQPRPANAGRKPGSENKLTTDIRAMLEAALDRAGGSDYLFAQAHENPKAFLALLGRLIPSQITGKDGEPLIPPENDRSKLALAILNIIRGETPEVKS